MDDDITCALKIRPPAVFDIADPFPIIYENFTKKGVFTPIENDLLGNFTLDVHTIGWKAVDFTGNGNKTSDAVHGDGKPRGAADVFRGLREIRGVRRLREL